MLGDNSEVWIHWTQMIEVLVTGGARLHRQQLRPLRAAGARRLARHHARQADLRRPAREPARRDGPPPPHVRARRHLRRAVAGAARRARRTSSCTSPPRRTSTARSWRPATSSAPTSKARSCCSRPRARTRSCAASCRSRPTRSTAACRRAPSTETDELRPRNPYSASKAGADRLAYSYFATYDVPVIVTRASNNYGPYQFPEKVLPLFVTNLVDDIPVPLYGDGGNVRDWLHVLDHCRAVDLLIARGRPTARSTTSAAATR